MDRKEPTHIELRLLDGKEFQGDTTTLYCKADKYAFEQRFDVGSGVLANMADIFDDDTGLRIKGTDASGVHDTWTDFFIWRACARAIPQLAQMSFEEFKDQVDDIELIAPKKKGEDGKSESLDPPKPSLQPA